MFEMVSFHTDACLKPLSPLIDGLINDYLPKVWPYQPGAVSARWCRVCASAKHILEDRPKFCNRPDLGWGYHVARGREKWNQVWPASCKMGWLPWQQLQLVLCCMNNFYSKLSSNVARTIRSNGTDIGRCLWKLLHSHNMRARFFWDTVY